MSDLAIQVENIGKQYFIGGAQQVQDRLSDQLVEMFAAPFRRTKKLLRGQATGAAELDEVFWALKDVSFEIKRGEVVGVIGRNGAGKSTLLKILSRITEPSRGYVDIYGRVGSLLEVGTGFHPELTGRENIYLNGAILGMKKSEITHKFDEIVDFAGIDKFINTPVKHYSSGMYTRLAFAVAANLEPEILLVDEVLAVGDAAFQKKCLGKMNDVAKQGRTVLFVSHNISLVQTLCQRGIFLADGQVVVNAGISEAVGAYLNSLKNAQSEQLADRVDRRGSGHARLLEIKISSGSSLSNRLVTGKPAKFVFRVDKLYPGIFCVFGLFDQYGHFITSFDSNNRSSNDQFRAEPCTEFVCNMDELLLWPGQYYMNVMITGSQGEYLDHIEGAIAFDVEEGHVAGRPQVVRNQGGICIPHQWVLPADRQ